MSGFVSILQPPDAVPHLQKLVDEIKDIPLNDLTPDRLRVATEVAEAGTVSERDTVPPPLTETAGAGTAANRSGVVPGGVERDTVPERDTVVEENPAAVEAGTLGLSVSDFVDNEAQAEADTRLDQDSVVERDTEVDRSQRPPPFQRDTVSQPTLDRPHKIRRCVVAQDGHSLGEEALYQALWNARIAKFETKETKLITAGWKVMSHIARLTPRNTKNNCQSLIEKLALELVAGENSSERIGRTYRVFSYKAILERRKAAGLEWVIRTRGVQFVDPPPPPPQPTRVVERDTVPGKGPVRGAGNVRFPKLVTLLSDRLGFAEDASIVSLVEACRRNALDATEEEIAHFTSAKLDLAARLRNIQNPMGFLLTAVPRCFQGDAFEHFRAAERLRKQAEAQREAALQEEMEFYRKQQQAILADPNSSEDDKSIARSILASFSD